MKAAILKEMGRSRPYANSRPLVVEDVDLDPPGPGELLIKIKATGLCHSDLSVINGDHAYHLRRLVQRRWLPF